MVKTRTKQRTTCPDGWLKAGVKVPVSLTVTSGPVRLPLRSALPVRSST